MKYKFEEHLDVLVWPDNTQCFRFELEDMQHMSDDYIAVPYGSLFYPDGITIHEVDYDLVVNSRRVLMKKALPSELSSCNKGD